MNKYLPLPKDLTADPNSADGPRAFKYWIRTVEDYLSTLQEYRKENEPEINKARIVRSFISQDIFALVEELQDYDSIIATLRQVYVKRKNNVYARHLLVSRKQETGENVAQYLLVLKSLAKDCTFQDVSADRYRNELIRDSFINGISSAAIRQRLLERDDVTLQQAFELADSLERAQLQAVSMNQNLLSSSSIVATTPIERDSEPCETNLPFNARDRLIASTSANTTTRLTAKTCYYCGGPFHKKIVCPAKGKTCFNCGKIGHFSKACKSPSSKTAHVSSTAFDTTVARYFTSTSTGAPHCLRRTVVESFINDYRVKTLFDTGASENFIDESLIKRLGIRYKKKPSNVTMASKALHLFTLGRAHVTLTILGKTYHNVSVDIMTNACADIILGQKFFSRFDTVTFFFGGEEGNLTISADTQNYASLAAASITPPRVFEYLSKDCKPIATRSRNYSSDDQKFIKTEIQRLIAEDIIEPSSSPWRAQVLVVRKFNKCRLVVDYSQTINRFTCLDAYPLPKIEKIVHKIGEDSFYSSLDLKSAYNQVPLLAKERHYTAFEAIGQLYQYKRLPFGVTNGASAFQRVIDNLIKRHNLQKVYAYLDDLTVTGSTLEEHDRNLEALLEAAKSEGLTFNEDKSKLRRNVIHLLGYEISHGQIKPDPERLEPLLEMPPPTTPKELKRICGMFAYYARWIENFSSKAGPLIKAKVFPISDEAFKAFLTLKKDLAEASLSCIQENVPFKIETDASDYAIAAILSQSERPVAFMSRMLTACERKYPTIEKEATAIIEAVRKWSHFLKCRPFTLVTDQRSISFMFNKNTHGKIKNSKIMLWRLELSQYYYEIQHKPGKQHVAPDAFSRFCGSTESRNSLRHVHDSLGHPGFSRLCHFVRARNLPFTCEEIRNICRNCTTCALVKPRFYRGDGGTLVKATQPWERLAVDFKGPVKGSKPYLLVIIDEYSRYPFVFPCKNISSETVVDCFSSLFCMFGFPNYIHSDRGSSFVSQKVRVFLNERGIASSLASPYHPQGNSQCERANQTIWRTIKLLLHSSGLEEQHWERVLPEALHAIRSLLCTTTNATPHERLFSFPRRAMSGTAMPTWLLDEGTKVLLRRFIRNKSEPLCDVVELIRANDNYARVLSKEGKEFTVSTSDLAPYPKSTHDEQSIQTPTNELFVNTENAVPETSGIPKILKEDQRTSDAQTKDCNIEDRSSDMRNVTNNTGAPENAYPDLRRSTRNRRPPQRYGDWAV